MTNELLLKKRLRNLEHNFKIGEVGQTQYEFHKKAILEELNSLCPKCKNNFLNKNIAENALSRKDNETMICSECGLVEALEDFIKS